MMWRKQPAKRRPRLGRSRARRSLHLAEHTVESLEARTLLAASLLADINTAPVYPDGMTFVTTSAGPRYFYTTQNASGGNDLYVTQIDGAGTASGTTLLRAFPAPQQRFYLPERAVFDLTGAGQTLFFTANDGTNGKELWKSDGTVGGTQLVRNINPSPGAGSYPTYLTNFNGTLFFSANDGTRGLELWKSDGTNAGTTIVSDVNPGPADTVPANLTPIPGSPTPRMIFTGRFLGGGTTQIVYSTDGNTIAPVDFTPGVVDDKFLFVDPLAVPFGKSTMKLPVIGNSVIIAGNDFATGDIGADQDLWITDGTGAGSSRIAALPNNNLVRQLTGVTNGAFFTLENRTSGNVDLWKSDGTTGGTSFLRNVKPSGSTDIVDTFVGTGTRLFYQVRKPSQDNVELWTSNGTAGGTVKIVDIRPGQAEPNNRYPFTGQAVGNNGTLYFTNIDTTNGMELWKSNGTPGGTALVKDVLAGAASSSPRNLTTVNGQVLFAARGAGGAAQLWRTDGNTAGTTAVLNIPVNSSESSNTQFAVRYGSLVLFAAADGALGSELWKTDGTTPGTQLVKDIRSNGGSVPMSGVNYKNEVYFLVLGTDSVAGLWKTNGTTAGTQLVRNITTLNSFSTSLVVYRNQLIFASLNPATAQTQLWMSDGTTSGTNPVASALFTNGQTTNEIRELVIAGDPAAGQDRLYFAVDNGTTGRELWSFTVNTNGTSPAVNLVSDINTSGGSNPRALVAFQNRLFFSANDGKTGEELWTTSGNSASTSRVADIEVGAASSAPDSLTPVGSLLYFAATTAVNGRELWYTNGTSVVRATDIAPGTGSSSPQQLRNVNGNIVFTAVAANTGRELYRYDRGGGTRLLLDINPGVGSGVPGGAPILSAGNILYFTANSPANGSELWSTDGTALGTKLVQDFYPGPNPSNPRALVQLASGNIMVAADNGLLGSEPYVVTPSTPAFKPLNDFNGDGKSDYAVYRPDLPTVDPIFNPAAPNLSYWYTILNQGDTSASVYDWERQWGLKGDIPVAGDYDGDGRTDYTVYRPTDVPGSSRGWYIALNRAGQPVEPVFSQGGGWPIVYGLPDDIPFPGDFNGDGRADIALYRPSEGRFYVQIINIVNQGGTLIAQPSTLVDGMPIWDPNGVALTGGTPVSGDFNGDGRDDFAVYRASGNLGTWYIRLNLPNGTYPYTLQQWGLAGDIPLAGDYNGDGRADMAVYRPTGDGVLSFENRLVSRWYPLLNLNLQVTPTPSSQINNTVQTYDLGRAHGLQGDIPLTGDYNGDGKDDYTVFRTNNLAADKVFYQGREVSRWYVVINGGTTWDWGRLHGYSQDVPIGRNPLLSRSTLPSSNSSVTSGLVPLSVQHEMETSSSLSGSSSLLGGIALAPTPNLTTTTLSDPFSLFKKRRLGR